MENSEGNRGEDGKDDVVESEVEDAVFDGYVAESTETRLKLTGVAVEAWSRDFKTTLFGVGIGGAGQVLYDESLSPSPKEIVQNEYASLLLETGLVGISLFVLIVVLTIRIFWNCVNGWVLISLLVAYGISLLFFSGLPNALQIYLMPVVLYVIYNSGLRK